MCSGGAHTYEQHVCRLSTRWTPRCMVFVGQAHAEHLPGPTHLTRHMQDPLLGEPQATPFAFSVPSHFTLSAVGLHANGRAAAALLHRSCARRDGSLASRWQAGAVACIRRLQRSDGSSRPATTSTEQARHDGLAQRLAQCSRFSMVLQPSRDGFGTAQAGRSRIALSDRA